MTEQDQVTTVEKSYDTFPELMKDLAESGIRAQEGVDQYHAHLNAALGKMPQNPYQLAQFIEKVVGYMNQAKA